MTQFLRQERCSAPFAWQRNKGILFYFTSNSASKIRFPHWCRGRVFHLSTNSIQYSQCCQFPLWKALKEGQEELCKACGQGKENTVADQGEDCPPRGTRTSRQQPVCQNISVHCCIWSLSSRDAGVDAWQWELDAPPPPPSHSWDSPPGTGEGKKPLELTEMSHHLNGTPG